MMGQIPIPGFYGKMRGAGDFVQRRLPPDFLDVWDRSFSRVIAESRDLLCERWLSVYHASPAWRFLLSPGVCNESAWAGVLTPSADRVGRCFPMMIAGRLASGTRLPGVLYDDGRWFGDVERAAGAAQHDGRINATMFDETVGSLLLPPEPEDPTIPLLPAWLEQRNRDYWLSLPDMTAPMLAALWVHLAPAGCGLWWSAGNDAISSRVLVSGGLPTTEVFVALLEVGADVAMERARLPFGTRTAGARP
jgi:type VI secretion system protein ImpM